MCVMQRPWCACCWSRVAAGWRAASVPCSSPAAERIQPWLGWGAGATGVAAMLLFLLSVSPCSPGGPVMLLGAAQPWTQMTHTCGKVCFTIMLKVLL